MADNQFHIKQNDTSPDLEVTIVDGDGSAVDVTGATIVFNMEAGGVNKITDGSVTIVTAASGVVKYVWQTGDTDTPGAFEGEFEVTFVGGVIETFPPTNAQRLNIIIGRQLA